MNSVCDMFRIGIGPSSSHTVGPMRAGKAFVDLLLNNGQMAEVSRIAVDLYGSLSATGKGHHTDNAIIMGLAGYAPDNVDIAMIADFIAHVAACERLPLAQGRHEVDFPRDTAITFHDNALPLHENGMTITAFAREAVICCKTYYSIGGGFVVEEQDFGRESVDDAKVPYAFANAAELLAHCEATGLTFSDLILQNELAMRSQHDIEAYFGQIWATMRACIVRGMHSEGLLPGPLQVPRRAAALHRALVAPQGTKVDPMQVMDWVNMFALAVSEENAAGGRVVTAPTNGACGIIPSVLAYYDRFIAPVETAHCLRYFLASGTVGLLYKMNASISGAEVGCQGEVGVACSMAAAGLAELLGAKPEQVCIAAEIGMEHNLGLTCDPVNGQVQVPCIERNAIASITAINAARMALQRDSKPRVSLDTVIATMYETGKDMNNKYRETSCGGLAVKVDCGQACFSRSCS